MRVLMLGWEFPPYVKGGLAVACLGMTQALAAGGTDIVFVLPRYSAAQHRFSDKLEVRAAGSFSLPELDTSFHHSVKHLWQDRLTVRPLESLLHPYATQETYAFELKRAYQAVLEAHASHKPAETYELTGGYGPDLMREVFRYSQLVAGLALQEQFDVVHAHDWMTYPAGMLVKALTGKPLIVHVHALEPDRSGYHVNREVAAIEKAGMEFADTVVAVSHFTKNLIVREYGIPENKISVVHNAVSRRDAGIYIRSAQKPREKRVLFMGRVTFQKGPDYFIEAAHRVLQRMPQVRFIMAGSGDMLYRMVRRAAQLRIGNRVHFTGFLRGADVDRMYALSDLYVMPSVSEPFGIAPLEAMLYDVPVIISRQSGVSEVVHNALKVDFWDIDEMANKICAVLKYPTLSREMVKNCRKDLKAIKWENAARELSGIYTATRQKSLH